MGAMSSWLVKGEADWPPALKPQLRKALAEEEQVVWLGQPRPRRHVVDAFPLVLFFIPWTGFSVYVACVIIFGMPERGTVWGRIPAAAILVGPFLAFGLGMLLSPIWLWVRARRTWYVITNRRLMVLLPTLRGPTRVWSYTPDRSAVLPCHEQPDGFGDLLFPGRFDTGTSERWFFDPYGFTGIDQVRAVANLVRVTFLGGECVPATSAVSPGTSVPPEFEEIVTAALTLGERLLWFGKPRPRRALLERVPVLLFAVPWTAFAVYWTYASLQHILRRHPPGPAPGLALFFPLFGVPFILIGLGMLFSPLWTALRARRMCYALTDRRLILWQPGLRGRAGITSYSADQLRNMNLTCRERPDGSGTITFTERGSAKRSPHRVDLLAIDRVRDVEDLVRLLLL